MLGDSAYQEIAKYLLDAIIKTPCKRSKNHNLAKKRNTTSVSIGKRPQ